MLTPQDTIEMCRALGKPVQLRLAGGAVRDTYGVKEEAGESADGEMSRVSTREVIMEIPEVHAQDLSKGDYLTTHEAVVFRLSERPLPDGDGFVQLRLYRA